LWRRIRQYFWFGGNDHQLVDVVLATIAANKWPGYPTWLMVMAPPGSGKTDLLCRMRHEDVLMVSQLTPNSLISGYRGGGGDPSLLARLDGKIMLVKDFTAILTAPRDARDAVIGILRDAYDGESSRSLGNLGLQTYQARFTVIAAVTPVYEHYYSVAQQLGERFLTFRMRHIDEDRVAKASFDNMQGDDRPLSRIESAFAAYIQHVHVPKISQMIFPNKYRRRLIDLAVLTAACRTHVHRSGPRRAISAAPQKETAGRLVRQLARIMMGIACSRGRANILEADFRIARRLAVDSLPPLTACLLRGLYRLRKECMQKYPGASYRWYVSAPAVRAVVHLNIGTVQQRMEDLEALGILLADPTSERHLRYMLADKYWRKMTEVNLWAE